ncbi:putative RNA-binding protein eif1ad [Thoreauomyces humboldtii]|nr:putative RNA-binding protein eif1ad [Thoreauomyces humboldtii]
MGRKQTSQQHLEELPLPVPGSSVVAKIVNNRGGGNYDVRLPTTQPDHSVTVSLPAKFKKLIWVKRGNYVIVELVPEVDENDPSPNRVVGEITHILHTDQIKNIRNEGLWPSEFDATPTPASVPVAQSTATDHSRSDSDNDDDLFVNSNRRVQSSDEEETDDDDELA